MSAAPALFDPPTEAPPSTGLRHFGDPLPWPRAGTKTMPGKDPRGVGGAGARELFAAGWVWKPWIKFYVPAEAEHRQEQIALLWTAAGLPMLKGPLVFRAEFIFARPTSHFGTGKNAGTIKPQYLDVRPGGTGHKNTEGRRTGGDTDNCVKLILDALNKIAYEDDGQIARVEAEKAFVDQAEGCDKPQTIYDLNPLTADRSAFG